MTDQEILGAAMAYTNKHSGGGGTTNYNQLENKPQINGVTLSGDKSASDLGLASEEDLVDKQDALSVGSYLTMNNNILSGSPHKNAEQHDYVQKFSYDGQIHSLTIPYTGKYKLQVWGASGGGANEGSSKGGFGGYSEGFVDLNANDVLYVCVGGKGNPSSGSTMGAAGYNGGGTGNNNSMGNIVRGAGGGATHIARVTGLLNELSSNLSDILIVAGGGGGAGFYSGSSYGIGGSGGGFQGATGYSRDGNSGVGGTQIAGGSGYGAGSFGQGGNFSSGHTYGGSGGGAGLYGGGASENNGGAGGGSSYISPNLTNACMYGYNVTESDVPAYKTMSVDTYNDLPVDRVAKNGDGYAVISFYDDGSDDLVTKGELDTELNAIKDGQNINSFADVETALSEKQAKLTFDDVPTENSPNPVKSGGVYSALAGKHDAFTVGDYLKLSNGTLSVQKSKGDDLYDYKFITTSTADVQPSVKIQRYINGVFQSETNYINDNVRDHPVTLDNLLTFTYGVNGYYWQYTLLENSNQHNKNDVVRWYYKTVVDYEETFDVPQQDTSKNLVLQEELVEKLPDAPTTDGTYNLQVTVSNGTPTYSWVPTT